VLVVMAKAFGPDRRLRKHAEFARAQGDRDTRRVGTSHFTLLLAPQRVPGPSRLGLVVGRRIGGAVQRNRVKRLCRECFRTTPSLVPDGVDLIVIARAGAPDLDLDRVRAEWLAVARLLQKRAAEALARRSGPHHPPRGSSTPVRGGGA
jgi:ribonuclease P protein component